MCSCKHEAAILHL